jgi:hypothetical protein
LVQLQAVGALVFAEELTERLQAELAVQIARVSIGGRLITVWADLSAFGRRIWNMELYIAEDSVIAGGQTVSIPRSITLGKVVIAYGSQLTKVAELIGQAAAEHPHLMKESAPDVLLEDFGDNALVFSLQFWMRLCPGVDGGRVRSELRHSIHALFDEAGISIAFPQRDIHLDATRPLEISVISSPARPDANRHRSRSNRFMHAPQVQLKPRSVGEGL